MKIAVALLTLVLCAPVWATSTVRFHNGVVTIGDSTGSVRKRAGEPDYVEKLETVMGGAAGERWEYDEGGKTVNLYIQNGRVVYIDEIMD